MPDWAARWALGGLRPVVLSLLSRPGLQYHPPRRSPEQGCGSGSAADTTTAQNDPEGAMPRTASEVSQKAALGTGQCRGGSSGNNDACVGTFAGSSHFDDIAQS